VYTSAHFLWDPGRTRQNNREIIESNMNLLVRLASAGSLLLFGGFLCAVLWKIATGGISLSYLLDGDVQDLDSSTGFSTEASAGRTQALMVTLFVAGYYLLQVIHNPKEFPKLPNAMVGALAGSQALYLGGKARAMLSGRMRDLFR
jgi:hypothetical protein